MFFFSFSVNVLPILKAEVIKYVISFRSVLPPDAVKVSVPHLINLLTSKSIVVHTYAAAAIEKILILQPNNIPLVQQADISPLASTTYNNLLAALSVQGSEQNEYVMKAMMRITNAIKTDMMQHAGLIVPQLVMKLQIVTKNPTKPHYIHYLFETLSIVIKVVCSSVDSAVGEFDRNLFPIFQEILQNEVDSLIPYVFQILSLLLERQKGDIPEPYMALLPFLVLPALWERPGYVTPMVRLLQSFIEKAHMNIVQMGKLEAILGVFNKLNASKTNDHEAFYLLQSLLINLPEQFLTNYWNQIFSIMFKRLTSSKTTKYIKSLLVFFSLFTCHCSAVKLIQIIENLQNGMFTMVIERLIISELQKVSGEIERKICAVGMANIIATPEVYSGKFANHWPALVECVVKLFEQPEDSGLPNNEHFIDVESAPAFQGSSARLLNAAKSNNDPLQGKVDNPKVFLAQQLSQLSQSQPGTMQGRLGQMPQEFQAHIMSYLQMAGVSLV